MCIMGRLQMRFFHHFHEHWPRVSVHFPLDKTIDTDSVHQALVCCVDAIPTNCLLCSLFKMVSIPVQNICMQLRDEKPLE